MIKICMGACPVANFTNTFMQCIANSMRKQYFGEKRERIKFAAGFTLIELALVAVIIMALVAFSTPLFKRTYEDLKLTSFSRELAAAMKFCQEMAVSERITTQLSIDRELRRYSILSLDEEAKDFVPVKSRWGRVFNFPARIDVETQEERVIFYPNGRITPALIYLSNKEAKTFTIETGKNSGVIKIYDYKKQ